MAQNITLLGASYSDVPSVELPKTGGGTAQFDDTTIASNAASASDITSGKLAFVNGELVTGTASGGGATLITKSITANGTYNASSDNADGYSSVTVNVSGGGGLVYETGTWTPATDISRGTIAFTNAHTTRPCSVIVSDATGTAPTGGTMIYWAVSSWYDAFGLPAYGSNSAAVYGGIRWAYATSSSYAANGTNINFLTGVSSQSCMSYVMTETEFHPYGNTSNYAWRAGRTYKWIAVWAPTS